MADDIKIALTLGTDSFKQSASQASSAVDKLKDKIGDLKGPIKDGMGGAFESVKGKLGGLLDSVFSLQGAIGALAGAFAVGKIISAAIEAENALNGVAISLQQSGEYSKDALKEVQDFAGGLQDLTGLGDDTALEMFALAQSFGLSKDQAKLAVTAANDLSAATGKDLKQSVEALSASFNGNIGKLGKLNPALNDLSKAQLEAGAAAQLLGEQFAGTAAAKLQTFGGAIGALNGRFGDLLEELGFLVTKNPQVVEVIRTLEQALKRLGTFVAENADEIRSWVSGGIRDFLTSLNLAVRTVQALGIALGGMDTLDVSGIFTKAATGVSFLVDQFLALREGLLEMKIAVREFGGDSFFTRLGFGGGDDSPEARLKELTDLKAALDGVKTSRDALLEAVARAGEGTLAVPDTSAFTSEIDKLITKLGELPTTVEIVVDSKITPGSNSGGGPSGYGDYNKSGKFVGPPAPERTKDGARTDQPPPGSLIPGLGDVAMIYGKAMGIAAASAVVKNILQGAAGAKKAIGQMAEAILPGLGPIAEALTAGPDIMRQMVNEFADALPILLDNLITAIPVVMEALAERAPDIIVALITAVPRIAVALISALTNPQLYIEVARGLLEAISGGLGFQSDKLQKVGESVKKSGEAFKLKAQEAGGRFAVKMQDTVNKIGTGLTRFFNTFPQKFVQGFQEGFGVFRSSMYSIGEVVRNLVMTALTGFAEFFVALPEALLAAFVNVGTAFLTFITTALPEAFAEGLTALSTAVQALGSVLASEITEGLKDLATGLVAAGNDLIAGIGRAPQVFLDALVNGAGQVLDAITPAGLKQGDRAGQGIAAETIGRWGLATGGMVRGSGNRDSVPATLAPGELVIDRTTGPRLNQFLDSYSKGAPAASGGGDMSMALLGKIVDLLQRPMTVETTAEVNGRTLADIILKLDRTNQRVRA